MKDLEKRILQKIKEEKIKPKSKMYFAVKRVLLWLFIVLTLLIASFALAVLFELFFAQETAFAKILAGGYLAYFFALAGLFWLGLFAFALVLLFVEYRNTKYGYRKNAGLVLVAAVLLSFAFAFALWEEGLEENMREYARKIMPIITTQKTREAMWHKPNKGLFVLIPLDEYEDEHYGDEKGYEKQDEHDEREEADDFDDHGEYESRKDTAEKINALGLFGESYVLDLKNISRKEKVILARASRIIVAGVLKENGEIEVCAIRFSPNTNKKEKAKINEILRQKGLTDTRRNGVFAKLLKQIETNGQNSRIYKCK